MTVCPKNNLCSIMLQLQQKKANKSHDQLYRNRVIRNARHDRQFSRYNLSLLADTLQIEKNKKIALMTDVAYIARLTIK